MNSTTKVDYFNGEEGYEFHNYCINELDRLINFNVPETIYKNIIEKCPSLVDEANPAKNLQLYLLMNLLERRNGIPLPDMLVEIICGYDPENPDTFHPPSLPAQELVEIADSNLRQLFEKLTGKSYLESFIKT